MRTRKSIYIISIVLVVSSGLASCATSPTPYPYNPKQSEALNIARAAKLSDLRDIPWDRYQKARDKALAKGATLDRPTLAGPAISGVATYLSRVQPLAGLGAGTAGTVDFALMWLGKPDSASAQSRLIAWMPRDMARTPDEAQMKMTELLSSAIKSAAAETAWPAGMRVVPENIQVQKDPSKRVIIVPVSGGKCDDELIRCMYPFFLGNKPPRASRAPELLGGREAYEFTATSSIDSTTWSSEGRSYRELSTPKREIPALDRVKTWRPVLPDVEFYSAISSHLPKWAYLYLTPADDRVSIPTEDGQRAFLRFPVILHQGRAMFFIEPNPG
ncbi:MAG: hypothetical protein ACYC1T_06695 [Sulfuricaulis sp.]